MSEYADLLIVDFFLLRLVPAFLRRLMFSYKLMLFALVAFADSGRLALGVGLG